VNKGLLSWRLVFCIFFSFLLVGCAKKESFRSLHLNSGIVKIDSLNQIVQIRDSLIQPILYTHVKDLHLQPVVKAKHLFVSVMLPSILVAKHQVKENKRRLEWLTRQQTWTKDDSLFYLQLQGRYKAKDINDLQQRMIVLPNSIILAQAAVESGWGQSRFFLEANNVFGIWSYNRNEPRIRARLNGAVHLKVYDDISRSISNYLQILGSARAYRSLRAAALKSDDPFVLLPHFKYYSISRERYIRVLKQMIVQNNFTQYDHFQIDPAYLSEEE